ncbi:hypothetical protein K461DRAFT_279189 [Myriangium duriaei CBS 260.36]|uniref:DNA helicase n=1 Tax=Myriangium duriaei CBS 260.36 TaxID=1168546 RepID=A0A9P4J3H1_9PEZI|nr:hypothetical protein K461DRAFT_279189 [Myriangium duriaei CBS 260.36]
MDSDPISEGTPQKRRKTDHTQFRSSQQYDDDDADNLFDTVPTQPLHQYRRPMNSKSSLLTQTLQNIESSPFETQPTQPLNDGPRSSPDIEVLASSPVRPSPIRPKPVASLMAPPGTAFRHPVFASSKRPSESQASVDRSTFEDPPPTANSDQDDDDDLDANIKPTNFVWDNKSGVTGSQDKREDFSRFVYNPKADDMAGAYGGQSRRPKPQAQTGPSRAMPVAPATTEVKSLADITDFQEFQKVQRMLTVLPGRAVSRLLDALRLKRGHFDDAVEYVISSDDVIDLVSSDIENNASKAGARPMSRPITKPVNRAKQDIKASQTIQEKYRATHKSPVKKSAEVQIQPAAEQESDTQPTRRRRLVQRKREPTPEPDEDEGIVISSDDSESEAEPVPQETDSNRRLLDFFNTCSDLDLADLANTDADTAQLIISKRPFSSFDEVREISSDQPTKSGRKARKAIGDKVLDVCTDMWEGYEAVDTLVEQCKGLGQPIWDSMKRWGLDLDAATKHGELEMTKIEDPHDSGVGTPASGVSLDDDITTPLRKKSVYLKQPEMMSKELLMKDYQVFGLNWLNLLWTKGLSCILADDMGLGKTCQVISFLAHLKETRVEGTHLVIVPGSTLENWMREFNNFCPDIEVFPYYGSQAEREDARARVEDDIDQIDVIVTTYEIAAGPKGDNKFLRKIVKPRVVVYDEGHMLKNANSNRHRELMRIPAKFRLLLTGTPLQNNLQELASLLGFILPSLFEESREPLSRIFNYKAKTTDNSSHAALLSAQRIARARSMMAPFILRRKKAQVLSILPAKHRRVQYCNMVSSQQKLWNKLVDQARADREAAEVKMSARGRKAAGVKPVHMSALRFCALHPLLLRNLYTDAKLKELQDILIKDPRSELRGNKPERVWDYLTNGIKGGDYGLHKFCAEREDYIPVSFQLQKQEWMRMSGKIPMLKSLLESWIPQGSRALIFSQFTTMLDILEAVLGTLDISFVRLDGSTRMQDRQERIDAFTQDDSIKVFMLSTKAGGAGINLAAADKVVILEGGFNPQDEIQAENRAHRVGQTREVEVVRLVTRGSVEELILALGESKLALDERVGAGIGSGAVQDDKAEKEGETKLEEMFFQKLAEGKMEPPISTEPDESLTDSEDVKEETDGQADVSAEVPVGVKSEDEGDGDHGAPNRRASRRKRTVPLVVEITSSPPTESEGRQANRRQKKAARAGADIAAMFRNGLRGRGVDVGE